MKAKQLEQTWNKCSKDSGDGCGPHPSPSPNVTSRHCGVLHLPGHQCHKGPQEHQHPHQQSPTEDVLPVAAEGDSDGALQPTPHSLHLH